MVVVFQLHVGAAVECRQPAEQRLQRVSVQERVVVLHARHVYWELQVCNKRGFSQLLKQLSNKVRL